MYDVLPLLYCLLSPMSPYYLPSVPLLLFSSPYSLVSILVLQGAAPNWRPVLSLPFKAPQDDFTPANLTQVRDIVTFTLFDQVSYTRLKPPSTHTPSPLHIHTHIYPPLPPLFLSSFPPPPPLAFFSPSPPPLLFPYPSALIRWSRMIPKQGVSWKESPPSVSSDGF